MKLIIEKSKLSETSENLLGEKFGQEVARHLIFFTESTCRFFQDSSQLHDIIYRKEADIETDLSKGLDCLGSLLRKKDALFHLGKAYNKLFNCPSMDASKDDFGVLFGQTRDTKIYRPDPNSAEYSPYVVGDDGVKWRNYNMPEEVGCLEMLDRLRRALDYAVNHAHEAPSRGVGRKPFPSGDRNFIWMMARHYERCVEIKAAYTRKGPFSFFLNTVANDVGNGVTYTDYEIEDSIKRLRKLDSL